MRRPARAAAAAVFACGWGGNQFTPLLVMYRESGLSVVTVDALLGAYVVGLVPGLLTAGMLAERFGRRPVMVAGTAASLVASVLLALGPVWAIAAGRFVTGVGVAVAMAVGSTWVTELTVRDGGDRALGTRRGALWLTLGFGLGAGVAGVLAQWAPRPTVLPYAVHVVLAGVALLAIVRVPETAVGWGGARGFEVTDPGAGRGVAGPGGAEVSRLGAGRRAAVPGAASRRAAGFGPSGFGASGAGWAGRFAGVRHPRFRRVITPMAPWIFGSAGVAYAIMPQLVGDRLGRWGLAYSTLLTVCTLGAGALVQPLAKRLDRTTSARGVLVGMIVMSLGLAVSAVAAVVRSPAVALVAAVVLGAAAYGIAVVSGLLELQRLARPEEVAALTGVYYALAYVGFLLPSLLALLSGVASYPVLLLALVLVAAGGTLTIARHSRTHLPY